MVTNTRNTELVAASINRIRQYRASQMLLTANSSRIVVFITVTAALGKEHIDSAMTFFT